MSADISDMKTTLKNIESLLLKQCDSIDQLTKELKGLKKQGQLPKTGIPVIPPPPPPPLGLIQPKRLQTDAKTQAHDQMLVELQTVLRYVYRANMLNIC